mmetsp:Transcript_27046/g.58894  ORF Transcript_27046/g.58894 Transcript_27046/m.58894 type:complete len:291 (+) Transcript_27046:804-1676(+)
MCLHRSHSRPRGKERAKTTPKVVGIHEATILGLPGRRTTTGSLAGTTRGAGKTARKQTAGKTTRKTTAGTNRPAGTMARTVGRTPKRTAGVTTRRTAGVTTKKTAGKTGTPGKIRAGMTKGTSLVRRQHRLANGSKRMISGPQKRAKSLTTLSADLSEMPSGTTAPRPKGERRMVGKEARGRLDQVTCLRLGKRTGAKSTTYTITGMPNLEKPPGKSLGESQMVALMAKERAKEEKGRASDECGYSIAAFAAALSPGMSEWAKGRIHRPRITKSNRRQHRARSLLATASN